MMPQRLFDAGYAAMKTVSWVRCRSNVLHDISPKTYARLVNLIGDAVIDRLIADVEADWHEECGGWRQPSCEKCLAYSSVLGILGKDVTLDVYPDPDD